MLDRDLLKEAIMAKYIFPKMEKIINNRIDDCNGGGML